MGCLYETAIYCHVSKFSEAADIFFIDLLLFCTSTDDLKVFKGTKGWHVFWPLLNHQVAFELGEEEYLQEC